MFNNPWGLHLTIVTSQTCHKHQDLMVDGGWGMREGRGRYTKSRNMSFSHAHCSEEFATDVFKHGILKWAISPTIFLTVMLVNESS